jgi:hypothetical protein
MRRMLSPITNRGIQLSMTEQLMANRAIAKSHVVTRPRLATRQLTNRQRCGPVGLVMQAWNHARW